MTTFLRQCLYGLASTMVCASAALAQSATPESAFNGKDVTYQLTAGSTLRSGDRLNDKLLVTVWERQIVKGTGSCSAGACPVSFNGSEMFARRTRLTIVSAADGKAWSGSTGSAGSDRDRDRYGSDRNRADRYPAGWTRMQRGDRGDKVRQLQDLLVRDGARLKPDGNFGRSTETAIRDLQRRRGLSVDGVAGFETLRALGV